MVEELSSFTSQDLADLDALIHGSRLMVNCSWV